MVLIKLDSEPGRDSEDSESDSQSESSESDVEKGEVHGQKTPKVAPPPPPPPPGPGTVQVSSTEYEGMKKRPDASVSKKPAKMSTRGGNGIVKQKKVYDPADVEMENISPRETKSTTAQPLQPPSSSSSGQQQEEGDRGQMSTRGASGIVKQKKMYDPDDTVVPQKSESGGSEAKVLPPPGPVTPKAKAKANTKETTTLKLQRSPSQRSTRSASSGPGKATQKKKPAKKPTLKRKESGSSTAKKEGPATKKLNTGGRKTNTATGGGSATKEPKGYAKLEGRCLETDVPVTIYITKLPATLGRKHATTDESFVSLGDAKSLSRIHAIFDYDEDDSCFSIRVKGRNGILISGQYYGPEKEETILLEPREPIKVGNLGVYFLPAAYKRPKQSYAELAEEIFKDIGPGIPLACKELSTLLERKYEYFKHQKDERATNLSSSLRDAVKRSSVFTKGGFIRQKAGAAKRLAFLLATDNSEVARKVKQDPEMTHDAKEINKKIQTVLKRKHL